MEPRANYFDEAPKLQQMPGASESSATFVIANEDHTLGNALRYVLMRDPSTTFCGYSMPHPSEPLVNLRLQTNGAPADDVLRAGLNTLIDMCTHIGEKIDAARVVEGEEAPSVAKVVAKGAGEAAKKKAAEAAAKK